jgi:hypothetical protein
MVAAAMELIDGASGARRKVCKKCKGVRGRIKKGCQICEICRRKATISKRNTPLAEQRRFSAKCLAVQEHLEGRRAEALGDGTNGK